MTEQHLKDVVSAVWHAIALFIILLIQALLFLIGWTLLADAMHFRHITFAGSVGVVYGLSVVGYCLAEGWKRGIK